MFKKRITQLIAILAAVLLMTGCGIEGLSASTLNALGDNDYSYEESMSENPENDATVEEQSDLAADASVEEDELMVWIPNSGKKYHSKSSCSNMKDPTQVPLSEAERRGFTACKKCW